MRCSTGRPLPSRQAIDAAMERALDIMPELLRCASAQKAMHTLHSASNRKADAATVKLPRLRSSRKRQRWPIQCGIVGLPNVGKSTLFNALTRAQIAAENYPFCTIDPNVGVVPVPDERLAQLSADRTAGEDRADRGGVRRYRRTGEGCLAGRRAGQSVPGAYPRGRCDRARGALLRERRHRACGGTHRSAVGSGDRSTPSWRWPIWPRWRKRWIAPSRRPRGGDKKARCAGATLSRRVRALLNEGKPARARTAER